MREKPEVVLYHGVLGVQQKPGEVLQVALFRCELFHFGPDDDSLVPHEQVIAEADKWNPFLGALCRRDILLIAGNVLGVLLLPDCLDTCPPSACKGHARDVVVERVLTAFTRYYGTEATFQAMDDDEVVQAGILCRCRTRVPMLVPQLH